MKKIYGLALVLTMFFAVLPASISAEEYGNIDCTEMTNEKCYFTDEEKDFLSKQEKEMNNLGYKLKERNVKVQTAPSTRSINGITRNTVQNVYTSDTVNRSDSRKGMKYLIDVAFNFYIDRLGQRLSFVSVASNVLNVSPSSLMSTWQKGDKLTSTESDVITDVFYRGYDGIGVERSFFVTEKTVAKVYWDLYTVAYGQPVRDSNDDTNTFTTVHYYDTNYCFNKAAQLRDSGVTWTTDDQY